jgi:hypothetical protein
MPTTSHENCLMRSLLAQAGLAGVPPKISRRTVSPMMHTAAPARCSSSAKRRPLASFQLPVSNQALVLPVTVVAQLRPLATTVTPARLRRHRGHAADLRGDGLGIGLGELRHAAATTARHPRAGRPGITISRLVPRLVIWFSIAAWRRCPA